MPPLVRWLVILLVTLLAVSVAAADDGDDDADLRAAKRFHDKGQKLFNLGRFDDALEQYQSAYDAKPLPAFLFNIGQCYRNLGDYEAAIFSFKKYLKLAPDAENREEVEEYIADLEAEEDKRAARKLRLAEKRRAAGDDAPRGDTPIYKTWWFWTGVAVVGAAGGYGVYAATRESGPPDTTLGNIVFTR